MINLNKWDSSDDGQKVQMCESLAGMANEKAISKEDYILMFRFLLSKVQGQ